MAVLSLQHKQKGKNTTCVTLKILTERTIGGGGAPGGPWPDGEDGSTSVIMSCVESEKDSEDTSEKKQKNKQDDRQWCWGVVRHATPGSDRVTVAVRAPTATAAF